MYLYVGRGKSDLPYDAVESCETEEVPFGGNPAPELVLYEQVFHRIIFCTHESWTVDPPSVFGFNE